LIDKFNFEVCQIETSIVIAIELICQVKENFIFFTLLLWEQEFMNHAFTNMPHLVMACDETIKLERHLVANI